MKKKLFSNFLKLSILILTLFNTNHITAKGISHYIQKPITKTNKDTLWKSLKFYKPKNYRNFLVIIPSYNNKDWYKKNLDSVFSQNYPFYQVIYIDDASSDETANLVEKYIKEKKQEHRATLIKNKNRMRALANYYTAIHACTDNDAIAVILDGDDWWANDHVLSLINNVYDKFDAWLTYGQYKTYPQGNIGISRKIPINVIKTNSIRNYKWITSQQRTFYVWLFKLIKQEDLLYEGEFFPVSGDVGVMLPMIEMAGMRSKFIPDIIYIYNKANSLNNSKIAPGFSMRKFIKQKHPYQLLTNRPI